MSGFLLNVVNIASNEVSMEIKLKVRRMTVKIINGFSRLGDNVKYST